MSIPWQCFHLNLMTLRFSVLVGQSQDSHNPRGLFSFCLMWITCNCVGMHEWLISANILHQKDLDTWPIKCDNILLTRIVNFYVLSLFNTWSSRSAFEGEDVTFISVFTFNFVMVGKFHWALARQYCIHVQNVFIMLFSLSLFDHWQLLVIWSDL